MTSEDHNRIHDFPAIRAQRYRRSEPLIADGLARHSSATDRPLRSLPIAGASQNTRPRTYGRSRRPRPRGAGQGHLANPRPTERYRRWCPRRLHSRTEWYRILSGAVGPLLSPGTPHQAPRRRELRNSPTIRSDGWVRDTALATFEPVPLAIFVGSLQCVCVCVVARAEAVATSGDLIWPPVGLSHGHGHLAAPPDRRSPIGAGPTAPNRRRRDV
jgi:hypothetical protein